MTTDPGSPASRPHLEELPGSRILREALRRPAWSLIRLPGQTDITVLGGVPSDHDRLIDVPLESGPPEPGRTFDRLVCVPFRQIRERGFEVHDDATPLRSIAIDVEAAVPESALEVLSSAEATRTTGHAGFVTDDDDYAALVQRVITDEIGNGEGANLVVARDYRADLVDWDASSALRIFSRLLQQERGAYWTYVVFTGDRYLIGASPERHVRVQAGAVSMNPISGTFRLRDGRRDDTTSDDATADPHLLRSRLLDFLADQKEIFELFMVVDEELKMMCALCSRGGTISGPFLKPMSHLVHTEYLLHGHTALDVRQVLRDSMFAATVTGSPVENACRLIARHESGGRGYYGAVLALVGRDDTGAATLDAPIVLRTADVSLDGSLRVTAGATLVRDSVPAAEVAETHAKAAGILSAFGLVPPATTEAPDLTAVLELPEVSAALGRRNSRLSRFWLTDQSGTPPAPDLVGRHVVVLDGADEFVTMLRHVLRVLGMTSTSIRHQDYRDGDFDSADLVVVGPGPGDPRKLTDPKIATFRRAVDTLLDAEKPFLAVCLGHQVLCGALGIPLVYKDIVFQGTQTQVRILGRDETVGFYNTFVARLGATTSLPAHVSVDADVETGDIHLVRGSHFAGIQFHAESILTENGSALLRDLLIGVSPGNRPSSRDGSAAGAV